MKNEKKSETVMTVHNNKAVACRYKSMLAFSQQGRSIEYIVEYMRKIGAMPQRHETTDGRAVSDVVALERTSKKYSDICESLKILGIRTRNGNVPSAATIRRFLRAYHPEMVPVRERRADSSKKVSVVYGIRRKNKNGDSAAFPSFVDKEHTTQEDREKHEERDAFLIREVLGTNDASERSLFLIREILGMSDASEHFKLFLIREILGRKQ